MKLLPKAKLAKEITLESLFTTGGTVDFAALQRKSWPYCKGRYKRSALEHTDHQFDVPVWYESRHDPSAIFEEDRNHIVLRCICQQELTEAEKVAFTRAVEVWKNIQAKHHQKATA